MHTDFSKPLGDIAPESDDWFHADRERKLRQDAFLRAHPAVRKRRFCLLCGRPLAGDAFIHRQVSYIHCGHGRFFHRLSAPVPGGTRLQSAARLRSEA